MQLDKVSGESDLTYHKRLVYGKLVDKTLEDYDYSELAKYVYGRDYSSDVARRMMYGSRATLDLIEKEAERGAGLDLLADVESKRIELAKERQRFFDQRREYNKLISESSRAEHLYESLIAAAENLPQTVGEMFPDSLIFGDDYSDSDAVLVLCDWHYGMTAKNVFNQYDTDICKSRVSHVVDSAISRIRLHRCRNLHIVVLGDLFHGAIHCSARVASEELVCDQIMQVSEILAQAIGELSEYVESVNVYMTYGNHGRTVQNKKDNIHRDNIERLIPWWLTWRLRDNQNVTIQDESDSEFLLFNIRGHDFCASHGDLDSVKNSPRLLTSLFQKQCGRDIEYILLGDKHHRESFDELGVTSMICGSLCGTDDYANDHRLYSTPAQMLLIVDEENGVDAEYALKCG